MLLQQQQAGGPQQRLWLDAAGAVTESEADGVVLAAAGGGVPVSPEFAAKVAAYLGSAAEPEPVAAAPGKQEADEAAAPVESPKGAPAAARRARR